MMSRKKGWFFIDQKGIESFQISYRQNSEFSSGRTFMEQARNQYVLLDPDGNPVGTSLFSGYKPFTLNGTAVASLDGRHFYINRTGQKIFDQSFEEANSYEFDVARVKGEGGWYLIDLKGKRISNDFDEIGQFVNDYAVASIHNFYGLADRNGDLILEPRYYDLRMVNQNTVRVVRGDDIGYYDVNKRQWVYRIGSDKRTESLVTR